MPEFRSGFASFVGRPNAGKSTLTNALVGTKVAITSSRPQTTRTVVRGIVHRPDAQLVLVDTPGLHRPRTLLGERLNDLVTTTWAEVDVVAVCFPADEKIGPGDRFIVNELAKVRRTTKMAVVTKTDLATPEQLAEQLLAVQRLGEETSTTWQEIVPVSAKAGDQVGLLADLLVAQMPEGPPLYPDGELTDAPGGDDRRRADPRGGARGRAGRAAALDRGARRGDGPAGGPARRQAAAGRARERLRRAVLAEGDRDRPQGRPAQGRRQRRARRRSRRCSARRSTSTCT